MRDSKDSNALDLVRGTVKSLTSGMTRQRFFGMQQDSRNLLPCDSLPKSSHRPQNSPIHWLSGRTNDGPTVLGVQFHVLRHATHLSWRTSTSTAEAAKHLVVRAKDDHCMKGLWRGLSYIRDQQGTTRNVIIDDLVASGTNPRR